MLGEFISEGSGITKGLYHLNGNSSDSSGNGSNGSDTNITYSLANGRFGQGAGFTTNSVIDLGANFSYERNQALTISAWIKPSATTGYMTIFGKQHSGSPYNGYSFYFDPNSVPKGIVFEEVNTVSTNHLSAGSGYTPSTTSWQHVLVTYDGSSSTSGVKIYINGVSQVITSLKNNLSASIIATENAKIGQRANSDNQYTGNIDEVLIFNYAWSATKIAKYYSFAKGRFGII